MLALFINTGKREARDMLVDKLGWTFLKGAEPRTVSKEDFSSEALIEAAQTQALFGGAGVFFFDNVLEGAWSAVQSNLKELASSPNAIIFFEEESGDFVDTFKKHKVFVYAKESVTEGSAPNKEVFKLSDTFMLRDKKQTWLTFQRLLPATSPLDMAFNLLWAARSMEIARIHSLSEGKLNPFVYRKAKAAAERYSREESLVILKELVSVANDGVWDEDAAEKIEKLILTRV